MSYFCWKNYLRVMNFGDIISKEYRKLNNRRFFSASVNDHALHVQHALNSFLRATAYKQDRKSRDFFHIERSVSYQQETAVRLCTVTYSIACEMLHLLTNEKERDMRMLQGWVSAAEVVRRLNFTRYTIYNLRDKLKQIGSTSVKGAHRARLGWARAARHQWTSSTDLCSETDP